MIKREFRIDSDGIIVIEKKFKYIERLGPEYNDPKLVAIAKEIDALFPDAFGRIYRDKEDCIEFLTHDVDADKLVTEIMARIKLLD